MKVDCAGVELGFVPNLQTLRSVLSGLSIGGKRWWIASDPHDALACGFLLIGHGDPLCSDRLNSIFFRVALLGHANCKQTSDLLILFDLSSVVPEEPGYYLEDGKLRQDSLEDFFCFYEPIEQALIARLREPNEA